ncbi:MAG: response regulator [Thermoanaerobaculaceae bacterium]
MQTLKSSPITGEAPPVAGVPLLSPEKAAERHIVLPALAGFGILGFFLAAGGTVALPVGGAVSLLWPAVALQFVLAIWFGWPGVAVAVLFPLVANLIVATPATAIAFTPANLIQAATPLLLFRGMGAHAFCRRPWDLAVLAFSALLASGLAATVGVHLQKLLLGGQGDTQLQWVTWWASNSACAFLLSWPMLRWVSPVLWGLKQTLLLGKGRAFALSLGAAIFGLAGAAVATAIALHLLPYFGLPLRYESIPGILGIGLLPVAAGAVHLLWRRLVLPLERLVADTELAFKGFFPEVSPHQELSELSLVRQRFAQVVKGLSEQKQRFADLFRAVGEPILLVDNEGKLVDANPAFERVFQAPLTQVRGRKVLAFLEPGARSALRDLFQGAPPPGPVTRRARIRRGGGDFRYVHLTVAPWRESDGRFSGYCVVTTDITREEEAAQRAQLQARLASLQHLLGGLGHEGNNVLQAALSQIEGLRLGQPELAAKLADLRETVDRMKALMEKVAMLAGELERVPVEAVPAAELVEAVREAAQSEPGRLFTVHAGSDLPTVKGERRVLRQAVMALVENAMEASSQDRPITVTFATEQIPPGWEGLSLPAGEYLLVEVRDQGRGIPPEDLPHVFDPFFTTKDRTTHHGVGLTLARGAALHAGGHLALQSKPGEETVAQLWLPVVKEEVATPSSPALQKVRVLVVDDDPQVLKSLADVLTSLGLETAQADGGEQALTLLEKERFDVVILDLLMPGLSGFEVLTKLKERRPHQPVILSSGYAPDQRVQEALQHPRTSYLRKPYSLQELQATLARALGVEGQAG